MINHYRSPYPNFIHQLFVTPSKHLYVLKDGRLKWQDKAMEVRLDAVDGSDREHVVHYIVADHTSSAFYAEVRTSRTLASPMEFLARAWRRKPDFFFHGVPEQLIVPTVVLGRFPALGGWLSDLQVGLVPPSSGFYAGVHQVRNWEKDVASVVSFHAHLGRTPCTMEDLAAEFTRVLHQANERELNRMGVRLSRRQLWEQPVEAAPPVRVMP